MGQSPFTGAWRGNIQLPTGDLEVAVTLDLDADPATGSIDIPAQGAHGLELIGIEVDADTVRFDIRDVPGAGFVGALEDGAIAGDFSQAGASFPFTLLPAAAAPAPADEARYLDPEGFFSVPVPTNWTAESKDGYSVLASPEARVNAFILSLPTTDVDAALAGAWQLVDPGFEQEVLQSIAAPAGNGIGAMQVVMYPNSPDRITQAIVRVAGERAYVAIFDGELAAAMERQSQLLIIDTGLQVVGAQAEDITGREARALTPELVAELEAFIQDAMAQGGVPGLAVAVVQDGRVVYADGFGVREQGGDEPVTAETLMMIGSTAEAYEFERR